MYDAGLASETDGKAIVLQRVKGIGKVCFSAPDGKTRLTDLYQSGSAKVRLPKVYDTPATAVLINTAGGLTGGDRLDFEVGADAGVHGNGCPRKPSCLTPRASAARCGPTWKAMRG